MVVRKLLCAANLLHRRGSQEEEGFEGSSAGNQRLQVAVREARTSRARSASSRRSSASRRSRASSSRRSSRLRNADSTQHVDALDQDDVDALDQNDMDDHNDAINNEDATQEEANLAATAVEEEEEEEDFLEGLVEDQDQHEEEEEEEEEEDNNVAEELANLLDRNAANVSGGTIGDLEAQIRALAEIQSAQAGEASRLEEQFDLLEGGIDPEEMDHLLALSLEYDMEQAMNQERLALDNEQESENLDLGLRMSNELQVYLENWASSVATGDLYTMERIFHEFGQQNARLVEAEDGTQSIAVEGNLSFQDLTIPALPPRVIISGNLSFRSCSLPDDDTAHWTCSRLALVNCHGDARTLMENIESAHKSASGVLGLQGLALDAMSSSEKPLSLELDNCQDLSHLETAGDEVVVMNKLKVKSCPALVTGPAKLKVLQTMELSNLPRLESIGRSNLHLGELTRIHRCPSLNTLCDDDLLIAGVLRIEDGKIERICEGALRYVPVIENDAASGGETSPSVTIECIETDTPLAARIDSPGMDVHFAGNKLPAKLCEGSIIVRSFSVSGPWSFHQRLMEQYGTEAEQSGTGRGSRRSHRGPSRDAGPLGIVVDELESEERFHDEDSGQSSRASQQAAAPTASPEPLGLRNWLDDVQATMSIHVKRLPVKDFRGKLSSPLLHLESLPMEDFPDWKCEAEKGSLQLVHCPLLEVVWPDDAPSVPISINVEDCAALERLSDQEVQLGSFRISRAQQMQRLARSIVFTGQESISIVDLPSLTRLSDDLAFFKDDITPQLFLRSVGIKSLSDIEGSGFTQLRVESCNELEDASLRGLWQSVEVVSCDKVARVEVGLTTRGGSGELTLKKLPLLQDIKLRTGCLRLNISDCPEFVGETITGDHDSDAGGDSGSYSGSSMRKPLDIGLLSGLRFLSLAGSSGLRTIPGPLPHTLRNLDLSNCPNLVHIPDDVFNAAPGRVILRLDRCASLQGIPPIHVASLSAEGCVGLREVGAGFRAGLVSRVREDGYIVRLSSALGDVNLRGCVALEKFEMKFVLGDLDLSGTAVRELQAMRVLGNLSCTHMGNLEIVHAGSLVGQQQPGIRRLPINAEVRFRYCPRLKSISMERVFGMLDISHCMSLEELAGPRMEVGVDLPLVTTWDSKPLLDSSYDMLKPGMLRLRNCPSLRKLPSHLICRGGLDVRYCMGLEDMSGVKLEVGFPALGSLSRSRQNDTTRAEAFASTTIIGCPMLEALPSRMVTYGDCIFAFLDGLKGLPSEALYYGHLIVSSCRGFTTVPSRMRVRDTFAIHSCETFEGVPAGWHHENPPALLTIAAARRLLRRRKSVQQAERRLDRTVPSQWRANSAQLEMCLLEHAAEQLRQRQRAWTANSKPVDYQWLRRNTFLGGARRSITRLRDRRLGSTSGARSAREGSFSSSDDLDVAASSSMVLLPREQEELARLEEETLREEANTSRSYHTEGDSDNAGQDEDGDGGNDDEVYMREFTSESNLFREDDESSQELAAQDLADEDYNSDDAEELREDDEVATTDPWSGNVSKWERTRLLHRTVISLCPGVKRIPEGVEAQSLALVNLTELVDVSEDLRVEVNLWVNSAPKLEQFPVTVIARLAQFGAEARLQMARFNEYCSSNPEAVVRRPSNWLARVRRRTGVPPERPITSRATMMLNATGIDAEELRSMREVSLQDAGDALEWVTWMADDLFQGDLGTSDALFDREEEEEEDLAEDDWDGGDADALNGNGNGSLGGEFEDFRTAVLFWKAAATGRPPRLMRMLFESEDDYEVLSCLDRVVDAAYRGSVLTFLDMLRRSREYRNPTTRRGLAERVVEVLHNVSQDEEARDELSARMADAIDACEDKPIWALNQMEVVGLIAHARGDREALRALGRRLVNLDIVHEAARKRIEQRGGFLDVDDVCVYLQYEIQFRLPLNLPVSSHFMVYGSTIPGEEVIRVSRAALNLSDEDFEAWLSRWPEWTRQDRFEYARSLQWEDLPRNGKRVSLGRSTLLGDDIPDPVRLSGATYSMEELLTHWVRTGMDFSNVRHSVQEMAKGLSRCDIVFEDDEDVVVPEGKR